MLFVCTGNSARSPIAEALLRRRAAGRVSVSSAGTRPKEHLHPEAVRVLADQFGIDIAGQQPRAVDDLVGRRFDHVVTLCDTAREARAQFPRHRRLVHWSIGDPAQADDGDRRLAFRRAAADIDVRVGHLLPSLVDATY